MPSEIYQTEGIILNSFDQGEADKVISVYTKEFGMIRLFARGTRRSSSKLNKFLNIFSYNRFGFVSGKDSWHLIDVEDLDHLDLIKEEAEKLSVLGNISKFLSRFHHGEERDQEIFNHLLSSIHFLQTAPNDILKDFENLFYYKSLAILGYLDDTSLEVEYADLPLKEDARATVENLVAEGIASSQL